MSNPEIRKLMCLSTAHITDETNERLGAQFGDVWGLFPRIAMGGDYDGAGYILYAIEPAHRMPGIPADLVAIYDYALRHGCQNILLDQDAVTVDDLPTYNW